MVTESITPPHPCIHMQTLAPPPGVQVLQCNDMIMAPVIQSRQHQFISCCPSRGAAAAAALLTTVTSAERYCDAFFNSSP